MIRGHDCGLDGTSKPAKQSRVSGSTWGQYREIRERLGKGMGP